jgi:hypothetical protein
MEDALVARLARLRGVEWEASSEVWHAIVRLVVIWAGAVAEIDWEFTTGIIMHRIREEAEASRYCRWRNDECRIRLHDYELSTRLSPSIRNKKVWIKNQIAYLYLCTGNLQLIDISRREGQCLEKRMQRDTFDRWQRNDQVRLSIIKLANAFLVDMHANSSTDTLKMAFTNFYDDDELDELGLTRKKGKLYSLPTLDILVDYL